MKIGHYVLILLCGLTGCHVPQKTEAHSPAKEMGIPGSNHPTETYHIDEPGVYTLVGPRACLETGIEIHCHNVTIDLNGHTLQGPGKDSGENYGIKTNNHQISPSAMARSGTLVTGALSIAARNSPRAIKGSSISKPSIMANAASALADRPI